ncbi:TetR/AcrR family transcriptional repressor of nem operon [Variovorax boronicumulans]|uniref:TetR/AcrR family transcriptional regulator n=1 Tax=Variovorax boronicumulans TaxID=436515 RepID=UPI002473E158|nr:TetR/AcrR family transcriptional regulator [Variovorax boronicumulans]MDH6169996.1 TetR/AcrR family transcriptional repressor of nem operon [Variovorax boronicumulans]
MNTRSQRERLVETGARMFHQRGYTATGVREVTSAAGVAQGSFTNHFRSKEQFGSEVLDHYAGLLDQIMNETLLGASGLPADRVAAYFDAITRSLEEQDWAVGCLVPDLAGEIPAHSEVLRVRLAEQFLHQTELFAQVLRDIVGADAAEDYAAFIMAAWHGTLLRTKVERDDRAIARFRRMLDRMLAE